MSNERIQQTLTSEFANSVLELTFRLLTSALMHSKINWSTTWQHLAR